MAIIPVLSSLVLISTQYARTTLNTPARGVKFVFEQFNFLTCSHSENKSTHEQYPLSKVDYGMEASDEIQNVTKYGNHKNSQS
jgi:hypothetical protein